MADNETIADVIAEMHRFAKQHEYDHPDMNTNAQGIEDYADRIDAAHRRERGNAAELREALTKILNLTNSLDENCAVDPVEIRDIAKAALSAPPRNCDLPKVVEYPWRAWMDDKSNWEDGYPKLEIHDWLLATATEKEGGAK